ncbi:MAG: NAD(P)H-dependent glycerol-3-phosphate dehydrogenase [Pseudomonadota bacterium]|uniref:NAD(P)H-dependent glycerol-3-phosphate dehydrogenase n=1 Tax=Pseudoalteromonas TaxID=53246 RepID=UPI00026C95DF|nr:MULTISPECIES: NAD(P)H-dependent glycerol-3-phosphate dehydrogenase [Pseudoalteromonas]ATC99344.1 glycerol-3-phosphate dehydrogenase (NAD(P)+) [Pseudoalteromonas spongiae UST010723-006]MEC8327913.1 NAD(P)H-dependent glycerol-3-phosphate dehydrogenase [Pseudomonadota bacterium]TMO85342.1 NAD(P)H-dependent glycerol-3-phosphate dehydrogenase [Pseudoalteromonas spongiae]
MTTSADNAVAVLGAGSYGTALAICFARNGHNVVLWGRNKDHIEALATARENQQYLPGAQFPESLSLNDDLAATVASSDVVLVVVPSHAFSETLKAIKPHLTAGARVLWATKGLEPNTGRLLQQLAAEVLGDDVSLGVLSGPTFAKEMAIGLPTAISLSSTDTKLVDDVSEMLHCGRSFRVYSNDDLVGVQLGGAIKNVIAIGAGISDGFGFGANARTALITRGLAEMSRLGVALGAKPETFMGMAGLGDLILTCTDNQSRNRRFGLALGKGQSVEQAQQEIGQVVEGYRNTKEVFLLAERSGIEMPICEQIYNVLYKGQDVKLAAMNLLGRQKKAEA